MVYVCVVWQLIGKWQLQSLTCRDTTVRQLLPPQNSQKPFRPASVSVAEVVVVSVCVVWHLIRMPTVLCDVTTATPPKKVQSQIPSGQPR